eukprot:scaffold22599_cov139-Cylindrotheca_fusiformis.AAC.39
MRAGIAQPRQNHSQLSLCKNSGEGNRDEEQSNLHPTICCSLLSRRDPARILSQMAVERIYIGGLDPPRLSGKDIIPRLKGLDIEVHSVIDKEGKSFVHLTATSKGSESALDIISKTYNNVKWKGCKIIVAEARPHFLERLEMERKELAESKKLSETKKDEPVVATASDDDKDSTIKIPRRLRIRRKHGDEAFHVDTRPWSVDNWSSFSKAKDKLRSRVKKNIAKRKETKNPSYKVMPMMHRAVHIRFDSSSKDIQSPIHSDSSSDDDLDSEPLSSADDDGLAGDGSEGSDDSLSERKAMNSSYAWSDDSDDDSQNDETKASDLGSEEEEFGPANYSSREVYPNENGQETVPSKPQAADRDDYPWSSESSSDESSEHISTRHSFQEVTTVDEFAAGIDLESDVRESDGEEQTPMEQNVSDYPLDDIKKDVSSNLNVLADLFPDLAKATPALVHEKLGVSDGSLSTKSPALDLSFGSKAVMPRFDPNDVVSTQKYEVHEGRSADSESSSKGEEDNMRSMGSHSSTKDELDDEDQKTEDRKRKEESTKEASNIYHQGKLEHVFREARISWESRKAEPSQKQTESSGAFTFGFQLDKPPIEATPTNEVGGFSFRFDLPQDPTVSDRPMQPQTRTNDVGNADMDVEATREIESPVVERRRKGLLYSMEELDSYENDFFAHNEGRRIMEDLQGFRADGEVRENWIKERQALTLDWKRKRKHAMSRIQKRMKFR